MHEREIEAILRVQPTFSADLMRGEAKLQLILYGADSATATSVILVQRLHELPEDVQAAILFILANWNGFDVEKDPTIAAKNFICALSKISMNQREFNEELLFELNKSIKVLQNNHSVWFCADDLPNEIWRDVLGYEGLYKVSYYGRVKSFQRVKPRILSPQQNNNGYLNMLLHKGGEIHPIGAHVLVAKAFIANPDEKPQVHHISADKHNNCVWNLSWVTNSENIQNALQSGRIKTGSANSCSKLTAEQVEEILKTAIPRDKKFGSRHLAKKFGIGNSTIYRIINGERCI